MTTINGANSKIAQANISRSSGEISSVVSNLSSGRRSDANVADFSVGTVLSTKVSTLKTATLNAGQAKSLLETAKGGLSTISDLLTQQKNLATKASDDSLSDNERSFLNQEFQALSTEINRIAANTNFNGKRLLDGSISGESTGSTTTEETTENNSLTNVAQFRLAGTVGDGDLDSTTTNDQTAGSFDGTTSDIFSAVASSDIGITKGQVTITINGDGVNDAETGVGDGQITIGGTAVDFAYTDTGVAATDGANFATAAAAALNASTEANVRQFTYEAVGNNLVITAADAGTDVNAVGIQVTASLGTTTATSLSGGDNFVAGAVDIATAVATSATNGTEGANRSGTGTFDTNLQGAITEITATVSQQGGIQTAVFTAEVNGETYTSNSIALQDTGAATVIKSGQSITFFNANGAKDSSGNLTDNGFQLNVGTSDITVGASGDTLTNIQDGLNDTAASFQNQLSATFIVQERSITGEEVSITDNTLTGALGTVLEGLEGYNETGDLQGALRIRSDKFGSDGSFGSIGAFSYDKDTGKLSTTIDGVTFTADLNLTSDGTDALLNEGYGLIDNDGGSALTSGVLSIDTADNVQIVLHSETEGDGDQIIIELSTPDADLNTVGNQTNGGVGDGTNAYTIDLNSETAAQAFESTLNALFGVADNGSLSFQVGTETTDFIGVSIGGASASDLHKDDDGVYQALDISTLEGAQLAGDVLDNAINAVISLISDTDAAISSFDSAIANNQASIQNADSARSTLLDTDYSIESTRYAEATVRFDAASSVLAQANGRIQSLLELLQF